MSSLAFKLVVLNCIWRLQNTVEYLTGLVTSLDHLLNASKPIGINIDGFPIRSTIPISNGLAQENGSATVTTTTLTIIGGAVLDPGDPIVLNLVINF
jgi:hypothetical protein